MITRADILAAIQAEREGPHRCAVPECDRRAVKAGYCEGHYGQIKRHGHITNAVLKPYGVQEECHARGCTRRAFARHLCSSHYQRHLRGRPVEGPLRKWTPRCEQP
jgi:hypothetical protein